MSVFYSYSNNREESVKLYNDVCKINNIIDVENNNDEVNLTNKMFKHIDSALIFVCDITPDLILDLTTKQSMNIDNIIDYNKLVGLPNPNVMLELGYHIQENGEYNIIFLCDETVTKKNANLIPSMLRGYEITYYDSSDEECYLDINDKINNLYNKMINEFENNIKWTMYKYKLSETFLLSLDELLDVKRKEYYIIINKDIKQGLIIINGYNSYSRKINIINKKLTLKNKEICLSKFPNIYNDLQHLELVLRLEFME
jgi:hypothetical protein